LQQRQTTLAAWCERIIEGGWLLALVLIPSYFNLLSSRHFEPDKATALRAIVLIMAAAGIVRWLEGSGGGSRQRAGPEDESSNPLAGLWKRFTSIPMAIPVTVYVLVFLMATALSVSPFASFWGSYQRLQGTYTNLSYIAIGALVVLNLRRREQLERLIAVAVLGSLPAVGYGLVQHFQIDPLPWRGDVVTRVASTMGNSIFVAAYLIMVLPFALYKAIAAFHEARKAPATERAGADFGWAAAYLLLVLGSLAIAFSAIKFGAVVRTNDLRYWWVYPGSLFVAFGLYLTPTLRLHSSDRFQIRALIPGIVALLYMLAVFMFFAAGEAAGGQQQAAQPGRGGLDWPWWLIGGTLLVIVGNVLFFVLPRRSGPSSALFLRIQAVGMAVVSALIVVTIFFTQSRGPWLGAFASLFIFFTLLLVLAMQRDRALGLGRYQLWRNLLIVEVAGSLAIAAFIVVFNFSNAPVFEQLRSVPYIGRMGRLLETDSGTGLVRRLIWTGDDKAGGAVGLITAEPLRTIVGWGPESMFMAYNRFYPPALAYVEARGASPDRSHQAYLDELVTKGVLGLISYLFVLFSFFALAWRLLRRIDDWPLKVLTLACLSIVVAHSVEGLAGIPIVASLMMLWVTIGVTIVTGALAGQYSLDGAAPVPVEAAPEPTPTASAKDRGGQRSSRRKQGSTRSAPARAPARRSSEANPAGWLVYGIIGVLAVVGAWMLNVDNVYADMRFQQGQVYAETPNAGLQQQITGMTHFLDAVRMEPEQDFYYLSLGRNVMNVVDIRRQLQDGQAQLGQPNPDVRLDDLLRQTDESSLQRFLFSQSLQENMSYAQAVLERAYELSPMNKDHSANLGRLHKFWYSRLTQDPQQLQQSIEWYKRGHEAAPQDIVILNEYAGTLALLGDYTSRQGDAGGAQAYYDEAGQLLDRSKFLDPQYAETDLLIADLARLRGDYAAATDQYVAAIENNPRALDSQFSTIIGTLSEQPDQLRRLLDAYTQASAVTPDDAALYSFIGQLNQQLGDLPAARDAFAQQVQLVPQDINALQQYTLVLSDTQEYQQAAVEAEKLLALLRQQQDEQRATLVEGLVSFFKQRAAAGG
jgi:tetratricopeptide (TPR) repeat protein